MSNARAQGNVSIFKDKAGGDRVQGNITPVGSRRFEQARARLGKLAGREKEQVSDADVIEYLARGERDTIAYIAKRALEESKKD
jgi:hypothetical protein